MGHKVWILLEPLTYIYIVWWLRRQYGWILHKCAAVFSQPAGEWKYSTRVSGGTGEGIYPPLALACPPPWICWEFYFTIQAFIKALMTQIMFVWRQSQIPPNWNGPNQNFLGSMPLGDRTLCTQIRTCLLPPIIHTISFFPPLGKKLKKKTKKKKKTCIYAYCLLNPQIIDLLYTTMILVASYA